MRGELAPVEGPFLLSGSELMSNLGYGLERETLNVESAKAQSNGAGRPARAYTDWYLSCV